MIQRIAFFINKHDLEEFFDTPIQRESLFEPHYNLAPAQHIPVLFKTGDTQDENNPVQMKRVRWGLDREGMESDINSIETNEALQGIEDGSYHRCVIPVSGYYKWKKSGKRAEYPFFIRMLDESLMALAGVAITVKNNGRQELQACAILLTDSNALIQPLDPKMPLQLTKDLARLWIEGTNPAEEILEEAKTRYQMTDLTVHRVSKKVNDLSENSPKLIQPLPK
ncbi:MAG: SOS response-associated peptidase family protein [Balneolaceae bacterium]